VIHAGIDGFSRTIVYAKCADNNRAVTSVGAFVEGVDTFSLPHQVRSDHGGENVDIWRYMLSTHSGDTSCILTGSSTHNELRGFGVMSTDVLVPHLQTHFIP